MDKIIFSTILILFPFGQLIKIGMFNIFDVSVLVLSIVLFLRRPKYPTWYKYFLTFSLFGLFSSVINYFIFGSDMFLKGLLYLVRLVSYSMVGVYTFNFLNSKSNSSSFLNKLLNVSIISAIFGWVQYIALPDTTWLKYLGWDDHLYRMIGTFLDPTYLALIIILGIVIATDKNKNKTTYFLIFSLAFTYSRISYLILFLLLLYKKKFLGIVLLLVTILFIPKMIGEGTNLARTASGFKKVDNYNETFEIIKRSPIFGIGFNNMCAARKFYLNDNNLESHACSGSDSSILFILATTGVVGLILFLSFIIRFPVNNLIFLSSVCILIHSLFSNSMFYPHVMFWMFSLIGLGSKVDSERT